MKAFEAQLKRALEALEKDGVYRRMRQVTGFPGPVETIDGREVLQFSSNDYLGLANHPQVLESASAALFEHGSGASASRLVSGNMDIHTRLEEALSEWLGVEAVLVYSSGAMANLAAVSSLLSENDSAFLDKQCHATLYDGVRLSGAEMKRFNHQDLDQLSRLLRASRPGVRRMVAVESVYSMDGDRAQVAATLEHCRHHGALLVVDEAHALGVLGKEGRGLVDMEGVDPSEVDLRTGTFSKAFGGQGGFIAGSRRLVEFLVNTSRGMIFSTGLSPVMAGAAMGALEVIREDAVRRERLRLNSVYLHRELRAAGFNILNPIGPIVPVIVGTPEDAMKAHAGLWEEGIFVPAIRPPTVPRSACRLRISVSSEHTVEQLEKLVGAMKKVIRVPSIR